MKQIFCFIINVENRGAAQDEAKGISLFLKHMYILGMHKHIVFICRIFKTTFFKVLVLLLKMESYP